MSSTQQKVYQAGVFSWLVTTTLLIFTALTALLATQLPNNKALLMNQPLIQRVCQYFDCSLLTQNTIQIDLSQLHITHHLIYQTSDTQFLVKFQLHNNARFAQPLPSLMIDAKGTHNEKVHRLTIQPQQYASFSSIPSQTMHSFELTVSDLPPLTRRYTINITKQ